jgi:hypothetical protein
MTKSSAIDKPPISANDLLVAYIDCGVDLMSLGHEGTSSKFVCKFSLDKKKYSSTNIWETVCRRAIMITEFESV